MPTVTASQYLPDPGGSRNELLQAGVLIFLKCLTADAEEFANLSGTVITRSLVREVEFLPWQSGKGAVGPAEAFRVHPRWFRHFANPGQAGVRFDVPGRLPTATVVQVYAEEPELTPLGRLLCQLTERFTNGQPTVPEAKRRAQVHGPKRRDERGATDGYEPPVGEGAEA